MTVAEIYEKHVASLPVEDRLRLAERIVGESANQINGVGEKPKRNIMELHGLGAELWKGIDAQKYIDEMRDEWDEPR